jgi:hypothetical protein
LTLSIRIVFDLIFLPASTSEIESSIKNEVSKLMSGKSFFAFKNKQIFGFLQGEELS